MEWSIIQDRDHRLMNRRRKMPKLLVFQHVPHEILGTLDPLLKEAGFRIKYINFGRENYKVLDLGGYDGLVVLGGPMNVDEVDLYPYLIPELKAVEEAMDGKMPMLGICLGSQLIAKALGARVRKNRVKEIGWYNIMPTKEAADDRLLSKLSGAEKIFQWHGDTFDIPDGAVHLARSADCENQAFKYGDNVYGLQFHLEVDKPMIKRWLADPVNVEELNGLKGVIDPEGIRRETDIYIDGLKELGASVFSEFIKLLSPKDKNYILPSR